MNDWDKAQAMLKERNLSVVFMDGHEIRILNHEKEAICTVKMADCNDDAQLCAVISAFYQGCDFTF